MRHILLQPSGSITLWSFFIVFAQLSWYSNVIIDRSKLVSFSNDMRQKFCSAECYRFIKVNHRLCCTLLIIERFVSVRAYFYVRRFPYWILLFSGTPHFNNITLSIIPCSALSDSISNLTLIRFNFLCLPLELTLIGFFPISNAFASAYRHRSSSVKIKWCKAKNMPLKASLLYTWFFYSGCIHLTSLNKCSLRFRFIISYNNINIFRFILRSMKVAFSLESFSALDR